MNSQLKSLFEDWRSTTHAEEEAIRGARWGEVAERQAHKRLLQNEIVNAMQAWEKIEPGIPGAAFREHFRPLLSELTSLERRNAALVAEAQAATRAEFTRVEQSVSTLRGVQRAYGSCAYSCWSSYS